MKTKMRPLKQLVSILTCIVLVFSVIPMATFAAESGTTGTLSYTLDDNGVLTISGSGAIAAMAFRNRNDITSVIISNGVTSIGNYAFYSCSSLEKVTVLGEIEAIGNYAFANCISLTTFEYWGTAVPSAGRSAFIGTTLREVLVTEDYEDDILGGKRVSKTLGDSSEPEKEKYTVTATATSANGGSVSGGGDYEEGKEVTLTATANVGYTFVGWRKNGALVSTNAEYTFTVTGDCELVAVFEANDSSISDIGNLDKTYDGCAVSTPTYNIVGDGAVAIEYKLRDADDSEYTTVAPINAGKYVVRVSMEATGNYPETSATKDFEIKKKVVTVTATAPNKVYDGTNNVDTSAITLEFSGLIVGETIDFAIQNAWYNGAAVGTNKIVPIVFHVTGDAVKNYIFPTGSEFLAPDYYVEARADITPKELTIVWGNSEFTYDGTEKFPAYTVEGIVDGDVVDFVHSGAATNARHEYIGVITDITGADGANYKFVGTPTKEFVIHKADQDAPVGLGKTNETVPGKSDGTITGVTANMEYREDNKTNYTAINSSVLENLAPGTYYVRYAGDTNHNPSDEVKIIIDAMIYSVVFDFDGGNVLGLTGPIEVPLNVNGTLTDNVPWPTKDGYTFLGYYTEDDVLIENPENYGFTQNTRLIARYAINEYTITVPAEQIGYKLETDVTKIEHGGDVYISVALKEGYKKTDAFAVKVNGKEIELTEYNNVVVQATEDLVITVEGVEPKSYVITFMDENGVCKTLTVKHGDKVEMPEPPTKDGYTVKWETVIDTATGNATIKAVYTKNSTPAPSAPQTGNSNHLWLWFVLLFVSSAEIFGITLYERKRNMKNKR